MTPVHVAPPRLSSIVREMLLYVRVNAFPYAIFKVAMWPLYVLPYPVLTDVR